MFQDIFIQDEELFQALQAKFKAEQGREARLAQIEAADVGKPLRQARADAVALARYCEFYGGAADKVMGETIPYLEGYTVYTLREPHGVTGQIVPWNYPLALSIGPLVSALAAGNRVMIKMSEATPRTAEAFKATLGRAFGDDHVAEPLALFFHRLDFEARK